MSCKYKVILDNGVEFELDSIASNSNETSLKLFEESLKNLLETNPEKINELLNKIESSKKVVLNIKDFDNSNTVGTTSLYYLSQSVSKQQNSDLQNKLVDGIRQITEWIKNNQLGLNFPDIFTNNVIATSFQSDDNSKLLTKYFPDRKFLVVDINQLSDYKYENILKGLIDYSLDMLTGDTNFVKEVTSLDIFKNKNYEDIKEIINNLPNDYSNIYDVFLYNLENTLGLSTGVLSQLYKMHGSVLNTTKFEESLKPKKGNSLETQAKIIYSNYKKFLNEVDIYYSENQNFKIPTNEELNEDSLLQTMPFIQAGDLIKYYDGTHPNGIFYFYVGTYEAKTLSKGNENKSFGRTHIIISKEGYVKEVNDSEISKDNNITYKKNISTKDYQVNQIKKFNIDFKANKAAYYNLNYDDNVSPEILKTLENGDYVFIKKNGIREAVAHYVLDVIGNTMVVLNGAKQEFLKLDSKLKITSLKLLKEIHPEINNINPSEISDFYNINNGFIANHVNDENLQELINPLKVGDIVRTQSKDGKSSFHNLVVGFNQNKSQITVLTSKNTTIEIPSNQILNIICNFKNNKKQIQNILKNKEKAEILLKDFNNNEYCTFPGKAKFDSYMSVIDVSIPSIYSNDLKTKLEIGDFVNIKNKLYSVLSINPTNITLFDNNKNIRVEKLENITHIIKSDLKLGFENKTLKMNSWFTGSLLDVNFNKVLNSGRFDKVEVKYVRSKIFESQPIKITEYDLVPAAYWVTLDEFNKNKENFQDLTEYITNYTYGERRQMYAINATTNKGIEYRLKNLGGYIKIGGLNNLDIDTFLNQVSEGMMVNLSNHMDFKTYRIEHVQNRGQVKGLFLSYSMLDNSGKVNSFIKFVPAQDLVTDGFINLKTLYSPHYFNINKNIQNSINLAASKKGLIGNNDKIEAFNKISEYLLENFNIKLNLINKNKIPLNILNKQSADDIKAYILNGEIFINYETASLIDPIHELMHLVLGVMKIKNPTEYLTLLNNSKKHPKFNEILETYKGNTKLDIYEEIFIDLFTETIKSKLNDFKLFDIPKLNSSIKSTLKSMFNLGKELDNISGIELLNKSTKDIINEYESELFLNPIQYYDSNLSNQSIKITSIKRKMLENQELEENCYE